MNKKFELSPERRELLEKLKDQPRLIDTLNDDFLKKAAEMPQLPPGWRYDFDSKIEDRGDNRIFVTVTATPKRIETA